MPGPGLPLADLERLATVDAPEAVARLDAILAALPTCDDPGTLEALRGRCRPRSPRSSPRSAWRCRRWPPRWPPTGR